MIFYVLKSSNKSIQQVAAKSLFGVEDVLASIPKKDFIKMNIRPYINQNGICPLRSVHELHLPQEYYQILIIGMNEDFLVYDPEDEY